MRLRRLRPAPLSLVGLSALLLLLFASACTTVPAGNPALPPGFDPNALPDVPLAGYLYFSTGAVAKAGVGSLVPDLKGTAEGDRQVGVRSFSVFVSPDPAGRALLVRFDGPDSRDTALGLVRRKGDVSFSYEVIGADSLLLTWGGGDWGAGLVEALRAGRTVSLEASYPEEWELIRRLPESPLFRPVGVGFGTLTDDFLARVQGAFGTDLGAVRTAVQSARVERAGFGIYVESSVTALPGLGREFFRKLPVGVLLVTKSSYPGILVSFAFRGMASQAGLESFDLSVEGRTERAYYTMPMTDFHAVLVNRANYFFVAVSADRGRAEALASQALR